MSKKILIICMVLTCVVSIGFFWWRFASKTSPDTENGLEGKEVENFERSTSGIYEDPDGRFSFQYPAGFSITPINDVDVGETLLISKKDDAKQQFQMFISKFDEPGPITSDRILEDVPDMIINEPQDAIVGKGKLRALIFKSNELAFDGDTREVWFVSNEYLYQITAPIALDPLVAEMMKTWKFSDED